jgi:alkylated DNA nucleotide flippase Atl1
VTKTTQVPTDLEQNYLDVASLVQRGEWSTYGDVSQVVHGHERAARAVGNAVRTYGVKPHSRLLRAGGQLPPWRRLPTNLGGLDQPAEPDEFRRLLESEGVQFTNGKAEPAGYVSAGVLRERLEGKRSGSE